MIPAYKRAYNVPCQKFIEAVCIVQHMHAVDGFLYTGYKTFMTKVM